jgi:hypothetical protein
MFAIMKKSKFTTGLAAVGSFLFLCLIFGGFLQMKVENMSLLMKAIIVLPPFWVYKALKPKK